MDMVHACIMACMDDWAGDPDVRQCASRALADDPEAMGLMARLFQAAIRSRVRGAPPGLDDVDLARAAIASWAAVQPDGASEAIE